MKRWAPFVILIITLLNLRAQTQDTLTIGYNLVPPFLEENDGKLVGPSAWLWEQVQEENELPYTIKYVNLKLDSLLKSLADGTVDIAVSPLTITSERSEEIDFSAPYYIAHSSIIQNEVSAIQKSFDFFRSFFSINFFRALGALALVILIFGFLVWLFERRNNKEEFGKGIKGLWSGFWWSAVTMTTVGYGDKSPKTIGGRIIALIWMFTAIIIISGFTASIASSLTVNRIGSASNAIQDFKNKTIGTIGESGTDEWLSDHFFSDRKTFTDMPALLRAFDEQQVEAVAYDRPILQRIIEADSLNKYRLLDIEFNPQFYAMGFNRDLPETLKQQINLSLLRNVEKMDWEILLSEYDLN